jgi:hypothetical protein
MGANGTEKNGDGNRKWSDCASSEYSDFFPCRNLISAMIDSAGLKHELLWSDLWKGGTAV